MNEKGRQSQFQRIFLSPWMLLFLSFSTAMRVGFHWYRDVYSVPKSISFGNPEYMQADALMENARASLSAAAIPLLAFAIVLFVAAAAGCFLRGKVWQILNRKPLIRLESVLHWVMWVLFLYFYSNNTFYLFGFSIGESAIAKWLNIVRMHIAWIIPAVCVLRVLAAFRTEGSYSFSGQRNTSSTIMVGVFFLIQFNAMPADALLVTGRITYEEPESDDPVRPADPALPGLEVIILDEDDGWSTGDPVYDIIDDEMARVFTDGNGDIQVNVTSDDPNGPDLYASTNFNALSTVDTLAYVRHGFPADPALVIFETDRRYDATNGVDALTVFIRDTMPSVNISYVVPDSTVVHHAAEALGEIYESAKWLKVETNFARDDSIRVVVGNAGAIAYQSPLLSWPITIGEERILLHTANPRSHHNGSISHEYGHAIMYALYGDLDDGGFADTHNLFTISNPEFAFYEGWPTFYANAVHGDSTYLTQDNADGSDGNAETNRWWYGERVNGGNPNGTAQSAEVIEGAVISIMWDLFDTDNSDEEFSTIDGTGLNFQNFDNIWLPMELTPHPKNIRAYWDKLGSLLTTPAEKTKVRGIFERNGVVLNREKFSASAMPAVSDTRLATHVIWGSANLATVAGPKPPVISDPVDIESRRVQILKAALSDTTNLADQELSDWQEITAHLYKETEWEPHDVSTGFSTTNTPTLDLYGILGATDYASKLALEGTRYAVRVQDKLEGGARASFYPDIDGDNDDPTINNPDIYTSEWLASQGTLRRVLLDNFAPFLVSLAVRVDGDTRYYGRWPTAFAPGGDTLLVDSVVEISETVAVVTSWMIDLQFSEVMDTRIAPAIRILFPGGESVVLSGTGSWPKASRYRLVTGAHPLGGISLAGAAVLEIAGAKDLAGTVLDGEPASIASRNPAGAWLRYEPAPDRQHRIVVGPTDLESVVFRFGYRLPDQPLLLEGAAYMESVGVRLSRGRVILSVPDREMAGPCWNDAGGRIVISDNRAAAQGSGIYAYDALTLLGTTIVADDGMHLPKIHEGWLIGAARYGQDVAVPVTSDVGTLTHKLLSGPYLDIPSDHLEDGMTAWEGDDSRILTSFSTQSYDDYGSALRINRADGSLERTIELIGDAYSDVFACDWSPGDSSLVLYAQHGNDMEFKDLHGDSTPPSAILQAPAFMGRGEAVAGLAWNGSAYDLVVRALDGSTTRVIVSGVYGWVSTSPVAAKLAYSHYDEPLSERSFHVVGAAPPGNAGALVMPWLRVDSVTLLGGVHCLGAIGQGSITFRTDEMMAWLPDSFLTESGLASGRLQIRIEISAADTSLDAGVDGLRITYAGLAPVVESGANPQGGQASGMTLRGMSASEGGMPIDWTDYSALLRSGGRLAEHLLRVDSGSLSSARLLMQWHPWKGRRFRRMQEAVWVDIPTPLLNRPGFALARYRGAGDWEMVPTSRDGQGSARALLAPGYVALFEGVPPSSRRSHMRNRLRRAQGGELPDARAEAGDLEVRMPLSTLGGLGMDEILIQSLDTHPLEIALGGHKLIGLVYDIRLRSGRTIFDTDVLVTIRYPDADGDGLIDGTRLSEESIVVMAYSTRVGSWETLLGEIDAAANRITARTRHFSLFRAAVPIVSGSSASLAQCFVYPNPYRPYDNDPENGRPYTASDPASGILFYRLTDRCVIEVFTLMGERVFRYETSASGGAVQWDARNRSGREVASGYYLYIVTNPATGERVRGRFAIVR